MFNGLLRWELSSGSSWDVPGRAVMARLRYLLLKGRALIKGTLYEKFSDMLPPRFSGASN